MLEKMINQYEDIHVIYKETKSIDDIKSFLNDNDDADILVLSAHGHYDANSNMAGLCVGNHIWMANDNDLKVPPIVLLSACHVSPRGSGVISVTDLFMRSGALAVLGTFIPVNVTRNGLLMIRFFLYIAETRQGKHPFKTLDEIWAFVVSSNAVKEVIEASQQIKTWAMEVNSNGSFPLKEFQYIKSVGRLRQSHIYEDTTKVLSEMLKGNRLESHFKEIVEAKNYFPESLFYQFVGFPENVFVYNELFKQLT